MPTDSRGQTWERYFQPEQPRPFRSKRVEYNGNDRIDVGSRDYTAVSAYLINVVNIDHTGGISSALRYRRKLLGMGKPKGGSSTAAASGAELLRSALNSRQRQGSSTDGVIVSCIGSL
jgi:hypothetical protein